MAEGGGGEVVLTDLEDGKEQKVEEVERKESKGGFTLGAEDGEELLGEMEFTMRHTQPTPYKVVVQKDPLYFLSSLQEDLASELAILSDEAFRAGAPPPGHWAGQPSGTLFFSFVGVSESFRVCIVCTPRFILKSDFRPNVRLE